MSEKRASRKAKQDLDHHVWKLLKKHSLQDKKILVALSGGADSVALLGTLAKIHKKSLLGACYFHHGEDSNQEYRRDAQDFCEKLCKKLEVSFFSLKSGQLAKSEAQYRELRYEAFHKLLRAEGFDLIATGHHRDDLLETRLLRLIRGSGAQGFQAMSVRAEGRFRPFLEVGKKELISYLKEEELRSFEDPSNQNLDPLRNWIREDWLKALEKKAKGSVQVLARSLETIASEVEDQGWGDLLLQNEAYKTHGLQRSFYLTLTEQEQKRLLAQYLFSLGKRDFSQSHIEEIQKRLDNAKKVITFKVAGCEWQINAEQIKVQS